MTSGNEFTVIFTTKKINTIPMTNKMLKKYEIPLLSESGAPKKLLLIKGVSHSNIYIITNSKSDFLTPMNLNINPTYLDHVSKTMTIKNHESDPDLMMLIFKGKNTKNMVDDIYNSKEFSSFLLTNFEEGRGSNVFTNIPLDEPISLKDSLKLYNELQEGIEFTKSQPLDEDSPLISPASSSSETYSPPKEMLKKEISRLTEENKDSAQNLLNILSRIEHAERSEAFLRQALLNKDIEIEHYKSEFLNHISNLEKQGNDKFNEVVARAHEIVNQSQSSIIHERSNYEQEIHSLRMQNTELQNRVNELSERYTAHITDSIYQQKEIEKYVSNFDSEMKRLHEYYNNQFQEMKDNHEKDKKMTEEQKTIKFMELKDVMNKEIKEKNKEKEDMLKYMQDREEYVKNVFNEQLESRVQGEFTKQVSNEVERRLKVEVDKRVEKLKEEYERKINKEVEKIKQDANTEITSHISKIKELLGEEKGKLFESEISRLDIMESRETLSTQNENIIGRRTSTGTLPDDTIQSSSVPLPGNAPKPKKLWGDYLKKDYIEANNGKRNMRNFTMGNEYIPKDFLHPAQNEMFYDPDQFNRLVKLKPHWDKFGNADHYPEESDKIFNSVSKLRDFYL